MIYLRHFEREWDFNPSTNELRVGVHRYLLCSERRPAEGGRPIIRIGENEWQVAPCTYHGGYFLRVPDSDFIVLLGTPESVSLNLYRLLA